MKKINKEKLPALWERLADEAALYLPVEEGGVVNFAPWKEGAAVNLDVINTMVPPKHLVFPQSENYLRFHVEGSKLEIEPLDVDGPYVVFGARPCDVAGIAIIDKLFLDEPCDTLYKERRDNGTIISLGCNEPEETCFCTSFDLEPGFSPDADISTWDLGEYLLWEPRNEKGQALTAKLDDLLEAADSGAAQAVEKLRQDAASREAAVVREHGWEVQGVKEALEDKFDSEIWDEIYRRCLGCGVCTYLCPTCHCFDVQDYSKGQEGLRFRCWDSCMFGDFTLMAHGENPRPTQKERVRQRFMHKLLYYPSNFEVYACVGCGRCVRKCPVNIDITQVIKAAGGVE